MMINKRFFAYFSFGLLLIILGFFTIFPFRFDMTEDGRYSIAEKSKGLMQHFNGEIQVHHYLNGELNPGFERLSKSVDDLLSDLDKAAPAGFTITHINPDEGENDSERLILYQNLINKGMKPMELFLKENNGSSTRKIVFPWLEISYRNKSVLVPLLSNNSAVSGEENLNNSVENLEFEITDALRRLLSDKTEKIVFLEGHGELNENETFSISKALSRYFQIDRGRIGVDASALDAYKVVVIAGPTKPFTETEKFILDQYLMNGGSIIWLTDGAYLDRQKLSKQGFTPVIENKLNLEDMFFRYGIKLNHELVEDLHCGSIPVNKASVGSSPEFVEIPWIYAPLLLTSPEHPVTRNIPEIKSDYTSWLEITTQKVKSDILLVSSDKSALFPLPGGIMLNEYKEPDIKLFTASYFPVAVLESGNFTSAFQNRLIPEEIQLNQPVRNVSLPARQLFIADADIIRNEYIGYASDSTVFPAGYDRISGIQFGNEIFMVNAVNFLAGNEEWLQLRSNNFKIRLLDREMSKSKKTTWQMLNVVFPLSLLIITGIFIYFLRKRKYGFLK